MSTSKTFTALCLNCYSSNEECVIFRDRGEPVCKKCLPKLKRVALQKMGTLFCKCGDCPIHNDPHPGEDITPPDD